MGVVGAALWMFPYAKVSVLWALERYTTTEWLSADWPMWGVGAYFWASTCSTSSSSAARTASATSPTWAAPLAGFLVCMAFRPHRDSEMASESKATLAEVKDLSVLSRMELAELHLGNPTDDLIVLHWMDKSLREAHGPKQECVDAFFKALPKMRREMDPRVLAAPILALSGKGLVKAREMVSLAGDLERAGDNQSAMRLYEVGLRRRRRHRRRAGDRLLPHRPHQRERRPPARPRRSPATPRSCTAGRWGRSRRRRRCGRRGFGSG